MFKKNDHKFQFQFIEGIQELVSPFIRVTKSVNGETGTVTFLFVSPTFLEKKNLSFSFSALESLSLISDQEPLKTKDITIFFREGKPFLAGPPSRQSVDPRYFPWPVALREVVT